MEKAAKIIAQQNRTTSAKIDKLPASAPKEESGVHQKIVDVVNNWISESRANRRAERAFSDEKISAWKIMPSSQATFEIDS